jgi:hypothetical protein
MTAIESRTAARVNLSVLQVAALSAATLCMAAYLGGALLGLAGGSFFFWWRPDVLFAAAVVSIGVFLLSSALRGGKLPRDGSADSRLWAREPWPAWLATVVGAGGVVLFAVLSNRWVDRFDLADAGLSVPATSMLETLGLLVLSPLMVLSPLLAAGVVWWVGRQRR